MIGPQDIGRLPAETLGWIPVPVSMWGGPVADIHGTFTDYPVAPQRVYGFRVPYGNSEVTNSSRTLGRLITVLGNAQRQWVLTLNRA